MEHVRVCVHALDRTGPPVLARTFVRWVRCTLPEVAVEVVAFRGGPMVDDLVRLSPVRVLLDPFEPWTIDTYGSRRGDQVRSSLALAPEPTVTLLVSVAAGQVLPLVDGSDTRVVTWVVEQGEDLHWLDAGLGLRRRTDLWLAGSEGSRQDLLERVDGLRENATDVVIAPEFVEISPTPPEEVISNCRASLGATPDDVLVVGAGIGTHRKAPDLFLEVAAALTTRISAPFRFVWFGGESDPLVPLVREQAAAWGLDRVRFVAGVEDLSGWISAADVFLHAARLDAFPLVCLHAASAAVPVVAFSGAGGVPEMLGDTFVGAPFPDVAGLAQCVVDLLDPALRRAVGDAQSMRVKSRFDVDRCAPVLAQLLGLVDH